MPTPNARPQLNPHTQEVDEDLQLWSESYFPSHPLILFISMDVSPEPQPSPRQPAAAAQSVREAPDRRYRVLEVWPARSGKTRI